jgi:hypothetical protein
MAILSQLRTQKPTMLHLFIELFFAVLPLIVLGAVWPNPGDKHPDGFLNAPEWSMTACVLYGLALARLQLGVVKPRTATTHTRALAIIVLGLIPLLGVIVSVILITQSVKAPESMLLVTMQLLNLAASLAVFFVIGGYGISRSLTQ